MYIDFIRNTGLFICIQAFILGVVLNSAVAQSVTADFSYTQDCESFEFQNLSSSTGGVNITGYQWNFGDGNNSLLTNPLHNYAGDGDYDVTLTVFHDGDDGEEVVVKTVSVWTPSASFLATSPCFGNPTEFTSSALSPNSPIELWEWDFDNDGTYDATGETASFTFATAGPFMVGHRVTNETGVSGCDSGQYSS